MVLMWLLLSGCAGIQRANRNIALIPTFKAGATMEEVFSVLGEPDVRQNRVIGGDVVIWYYRIVPRDPLGLDSKLTGTTPMYFQNGRLFYVP